MSCPSDTDKMRTTSNLLPRRAIDLQLFEACNAIILRRTLGRDKFNLNEWHWDLDLASTYAK